MLQMLDVCLVARSRSLGDASTKIQVYGFSIDQFDAFLLFYKMTQILQFIIRLYVTFHDTRHDLCLFLSFLLT